MSEKPNPFAESFGSKRRPAPNARTPNGVDHGLATASPSVEDSTADREMVDMLANPDMSVMRLNRRPPPVLI